MKTTEDIEMLFPASLPEALALLAGEGTRGTPLAGGTDLMVQWESGALPVPERVINVQGLPELKGISDSGDRVTIGGGATHLEIRRSPLVQQHLPALAQAAATVGGIQMQSMGTIAGSMANASPAGDPEPALLVTDGEVVVAGVEGERKVPLTSFWRGYRKVDLHPGELIVRLELPKLAPGQQEGFRKLGPRKAQAISKVMGAYRADVDGNVVRSLRVAMGSVAPTAIRLPAFEKWIAGKPLEDQVLEEAESRVSNEVAPIDDIRSTAAYRKWVSGRIVRGFLQSLRKPAK